MKKILLFIAVILTTNLLSANEIKFSKTINDYNYIFKSNETNKLFISDLEVFNSTNKSICKISFTNNENLEDYKIKNNQNVLDISKVIKVTQNDLTKIIIELDLFLDSILLAYPNEINNTNQLWFHYSILNTLKRYSENNVCECTIHPAHLTNNSNFSCIEDHKVDRLEIKKIIETNVDKFSDDNSKKLLTYINSNNNTSISFKEVYNFYYPIQQYKNDILKKAYCLFGSGSDHGCCGNYKGCCYYWHGICYLHDAACTDCKPRWFCFSGCIPD